MNAFLESLRPHPHVEEWLISVAVSIAFFDGKELPFIFDGVSVDNEDLNEHVKVAMNFQSLEKESTRAYATPFVVENYLQVKTAFKSLGWQVPEIEESDIWNYVHPSELIVSRRHRRDQDIYVQAHCECEWEEEHGLQLVFRRGLQLTRVSDIDGHLTESDAFDRPDSEDVLLSKFSYQ